MATGFPVKANYATGDVLTAANMNDLSGTVNYLQYMPPRNPVLNSNFSVWQRGTSFTIASSTLTYTADRWQVYRGATGLTVSRQATGDTANLPNIQYCFRTQRDSGNTSTAAIYFNQSFESVNAIPFAGKQVTLSFYARAGANFSAASSYLVAQLQAGTGTDQNVNSGYTGGTTVLTSNIVLTTTWQRFTITGTVGSTITEFAPYFVWTPVGTAGAADYVEVTGVQLELGSVANTYMPNQPTYQGELAACQRYCYKATVTQTSGIFGTGLTTSSTNATHLIPFPVTMRTSPTLTASGTFSSENTSAYTGTTVALAGNTGSPDKARVNHTSSGMTSNQPVLLCASNDTNAYLLFAAEL